MSAEFPLSRDLKNNANLSFYSEEEARKYLKWVYEPTISYGVKAYEGEVSDYPMKKPPDEFFYEALASLKDREVTGHEAAQLVSALYKTYGRYTHYVLKRSVGGGIGILSIRKFFPDLLTSFTKQMKAKDISKEDLPDLGYPLYAQIKYDGHYSTIRKVDDKATFYTSGGHVYQHPEAAPSFLRNGEGVYLAERHGGEGKLGERGLAALRGGSKAKAAQSSNTYKIFDFLTLEEYAKGYSDVGYDDRLNRLKTFHSDEYASVVFSNLCLRPKEVLDFSDAVRAANFEGLILRHKNMPWRDSKSRRKDFCKYKARKSADLLVTGVEFSISGKYTDMIKSLICKDSQDRIVLVGSGMSDADRAQDPNYFIGKVVEVFYERIDKTYIQATFGSEYEGVLIREDKTENDID